MVKKTRQPYAPPTTWDAGPDTPAARRMAIVEPAAEIDPATGSRINPNSVKRVRKISVCELYRRRGYLTKREADAADRLIKAWERNHRSPPAIKEIQVDHSPKPDAFIAIQIDRISKYTSIAKHVPNKYRPFVMHCARDDQHLMSMPGYRRNAYMVRLKRGLGLLADGLGL